MKPFLLTLTYLCFSWTIHAQKPKLTLTGTAGVSYEHYGLHRNTNSLPLIYTQRRPWNLVRFNLQPQLALGELKIPFNLNFTPFNTNFITAIPGGGGYSWRGGLPGMPGGKQTLWQFITNPLNNIGVAPKYKWAQALLGTQFVQYSPLSTGDLSTFGYGISLTPGKFRIRYFNGVSQRAVNYVAPVITPPTSPGTPGAYKRSHWMAQLGLEKEDLYFVGFQFAKTKDAAASVTPTPLPTPPIGIMPQDNVVVSFLAKAQTQNGWNYNIELGQTFHTKNQLAPAAISPLKDFKPFIKQNTSTGRDNALNLQVNKKFKNWELGVRSGYFGAGYYTAGYQYLNPDRLEYTLNTRFNAFKNKMNFTGAIGQRFGNWSLSSGPTRSKQIIANANLFAQLSEHLSLNASYNNFGYDAPGTFGYRSVSNDLSINPTLSWSGSKMSQVLSASYSWSKYNETTWPGPILSHNNAHTGLLMYMPVFFNSKITPEASLMYFYNHTMPLAATIQIMSATLGAGWQAKPTLQLKTQLQYNHTTIQPFTPNHNLMATLGTRWSLSKKLAWDATYTANLLRFGSEKPGASLTPAYSGYPAYMETTFRTGLLYTFNNK